MTLSYIPTFLLADSTKDEQELLYGQQKWDWKDIFAKKISVEIKNKLEGGDPITFVCKSLDDNLGTHTLYPGQAYEWSFRKAVFGETRFFCNLRWRDYSVDFDAWNYSDCTKCVWEATNDVLIGPDTYVNWKK